MKITAITIINLDQKPPANPSKNSFTKCSPPNARNAAVKIAAPNRIMKTNAVALAVSIITPFKVSSILNAL